MISRSKSQRNVGGSGTTDRVSFSDRGSSLGQDPRGSLVAAAAGGGDTHTPPTTAVKTPVGKGGKVGLGQIKEEEATSPQTPPAIGAEEGESAKLTMPPPPPEASSKAPSPSAKVPSGTGSASPSRKTNGSSKPPLSGDASAPPTASLEHTPETKVSIQQRANLAAKAAEQNLIVDALATSSSNFPVPSKTPRPHTDLEGNRNTPSLYSSRANTSSVRMTGKDQPVTPGSAGRQTRTMSVRMSPSSNGQQTNTAQKRLSFALTGSAASVIAGGLDLS